MRALEIQTQEKNYQPDLRSHYDDMAFSELESEARSFLESNPDIKKVYFETKTVKKVLGIPFRRTCSIVKAKRSWFSGKIKVRRIR